MDWPLPLGCLTMAENLEATDAEFISELNKYNEACAIWAAAERALSDAERVGVEAGERVKALLGEKSVRVIVARSKRASAKVVDEMGGVVNETPKDFFADQIEPFYGVTKFMNSTTGQKLIVVGHEHRLVPKLPLTPYQQKEKIVDALVGIAISSTKKMNDKSQELLGLLRQNYMSQTLEELEIKWAESGRPWPY
jgi:hypothetical protein